MAKILIGTSGWSYTDWKDVVYPKSEKDTLSYIINYLDCVEINTTFYQIPRKSYVQGWVEKARNKNFSFIIKANRIFTHEKDFETKDVKDFINSVKHLLPNSPLLFQFPFYFTCNNETIKKLVHIAKCFEEQQKILEVRSNTFDSPEIIEMLHNIGYTFCLPDYPFNKNSFNNQSITNGNMVYFRLHGRNREKWFSKNKDMKSYEKYNYLYSSEEEDDLIDKINNLSKNTKILYIIANNHYRGKSFVNSLFLKSKLNETRVHVPPLLLKEYPELESIKLKQDITGQGMLF